MTASCARALTALFSVMCAEASNDRPVIGVMVQPIVAKDVALQKFGSYYLPASYVHFLESAGARATPVFHNSSEADRQALFQQLSGLLIPGGHCGFHGTDFGKATEHWLDMAAAANRAGDVFAVHGICQGFQQINQWAAGGLSSKSVMTKTDAEDLLLPLQAPQGAAWPPADSWLLQNATQDVLEALATMKTTVNLHHYGISTSLYSPGGALDNGVLRQVAINHDRVGKPFVSLVEGKQLPFTGSQYHPEKNAFEFGGVWNADPDIVDVHSEVGIAASHWIAQRLVANARKCSHRWNGSEAFLLFRSFAPVPPHEGLDWEETYFFGAPMSPSVLV